MFEIGDILTLENENQYVISKLKKYNNIIYMLLIDTKDFVVSKFVKFVEPDGIEEIEDPNLIIWLAEYFNQD